MDPQRDPHREEARDFLTSRRARLGPEQAGLPIYGANRRVKGLRRDEVAVLSSISTDYYTRLERGNLTGVSHQVLEALAAALQLDESERAHLFDLAHVANTRSSAASPGSGPAASGSASGRGRKLGLRPGVRLILDGMSAPAYVRNARMDVLALNALGRALFADALGNRADRAPASTSRATCSWTTGRATSTRTGRRSPGTPRLPYASMAAAIPTTGACPTSSVSCPPAARSSAPGGPPTRSSSTARPPSSCTTASPVTSSSPVRR